MAKRVRSELPPEESRSNLLAKHPWMMERGLPMVVGTDLDALMSALFLHHVRQWRIVGFYNLESIYGVQGESLESLRKAVWVDLDIAQADIRSIGHHILTQRREEVPTVLRSSLNPNLHRGISAGQFARKYPLAALHWLAWLLDQKFECRSRLQRCLLWLPDSAWIVVQKYRANVEDWLRNFMPHRALLATFADCDTRAFESSMANLFARLAPLEGFRQQTRGQIRSRNLGLQGFQFRMSDPTSEQPQIQAAFAELGAIMGWKTPTLPPMRELIRGTINPHKTDLAKFLLSERGSFLTRFGMLRWWRTPQSRRSTGYRHRGAAVTRLNRRSTRSTVMTWA